MSNFNDDDYREYGDFSLPFDGSISSNQANHENPNRQSSTKSGGLKEFLGGVVMLIIIGVAFTISYLLFGSKPEATWQFGCTFAGILFVLLLVCLGTYSLLSKICIRVISFLRMKYYNW